MSLAFLPAHFDGKRIMLDEPSALEPGTKVFVTIVPPEITSDEEHDAWFASFTATMNAAYADGEFDCEWPDAAQSSDQHTKSGTLPT